MPKLAQHAITVAQTKAAANSDKVQHLAQATSRSD